MDKSKDKLVLQTFLWIFCILFIIPILFVIINSFKGYGEILINSLALPKGMNFENYVEVWKDTRYYLVFCNTLFITAASTTVIVVLASMTGYKLSRSKNRISWLILTYFLFSMMIPFQTIMIPMAKLVKSLSLSDNLLALVLIYAGTTCSFSILLYHGFTKTVPHEIEESALIDGCHSVRMYFRIVFPLLKPVTSTVIILSIVTYWNDLILPLILIRNKNLYTITLSQLIFFGEYGQNRINLLLTSAVISSVPIILVYVFAQKYMISGIMSGAVKT